MNSVNFLNNLALSKATFNFGAGVPPLDAYAPFDEIECLQQFKKEYPNAPLNHYHQTQGFINELSCEYFKTDGFTQSTAGQIAITNGVQEAITVTALLFKNKTFACIDPYYPGFFDVVKMIGNTPTLISSNEWLSELENLPKGSLFYLSADFSNPTGKRLTQEERKRLIEIARARDLYLFDDATYRPFYLDESFVPLVEMAPERVFFASSFSKFLAPGVRIAMIHVPQNYYQLFLNIKANVSLNCSGYTQAIVGGWLIKKKFDVRSHLSTFIAQLRLKQQMLHRHSISYDGGFFVRIQLEDQQTDMNWCTALLAKEDVAVCPMELFSLQQASKNQLRISIAKISPENLEIGIMKILNFEVQ